MLIEFKVSNFRSIREQQTFSLVASNADKELPGCVIERNLPGLSKLKFLKGAALYGANASGKSNVLDAIRFLKKFVETSATEIKPGDPTGTTPFKLDAESASKPSSFEITFVATDGVRYQFGLSVTPTRVIEEYLLAYPKNRAQQWYHRSYNEEKKTYEWAKPASAFKHDKDLQERTRENSLFLSVGPQFNHTQLTPVFDWFKENLRFPDIGRKDSLYESLTAEILVKNPDYREYFISLLKNADIGIVDILVGNGNYDIEGIKRILETDYIPTTKVVAIKNALMAMPITKDMIKIRLAHQTENIEQVLFDMEEESEGTRRYFEMIGPWIAFLAHGDTFFIEEIETSLHPLLVRELLQLLFNKKNPESAQVVFTTHSPLLLDSGLLRRDQIWFTEKTPAGTTHLYPLTDYSPRKDEALAKGYLAGRYGAIPYIPEGLLR